MQWEVENEAILGHRFDYCGRVGSFSDSSSHPPFRSQEMLMLALRILGSVSPDPHYPYSPALLILFQEINPAIKSLPASTKMECFLTRAGEQLTVSQRIYWLAY